VDLVEQAAHELGTLRDVVAPDCRTRLGQRDSEDLSPEALGAMRRPGHRRARPTSPTRGAWVWSRKAGFLELRHDFDAALVDGNLATCDVVPWSCSTARATRKSSLRSARSSTGWPTARSGRKRWERAVWVYEQLSARGGAQQRSVKRPDLLGRRSGRGGRVAVLHDHDDDRIAQITGQPITWLAPRGSLR
jgi:hypothetical protein